MTTRSSSQRANRKSSDKKTLPGPPKKSEKGQQETGKTPAPGLLPGWAAGAALFFLALLVYLPALHAGFTWDDDIFAESSLLRSAGGLWKIWTAPDLLAKESHYWPLVYTSFWLEQLFFGLKPAVFHLTNILLHGACVLLLWRILALLAVPGAWLAAALFAVHPVHVESVAWVIERKDVLSGACFLGSAWAFLRWGGMGKADRMGGMDRMDKGGGACPTNYGKRPLYLLSLGFFAGALLSKSIVVGLPLALGIVLWWRNGRLTRRDMIALAPLALLAVAAMALDLWVHHGKGTSFGSGVGLPGRVLLAGRAFWFYLAKLAWPYPLASFYPMWDVRLGNPLAWAPLLGVAALLAGLWVARGRIGRGPLAVTLFFGVMLGPVLGLVDHEFMHLSWVADRFQYLASAGPLALAAAAVAGLAERRKWSVAAVRGGAAVVLTLLGFLCLRQARVYRDSVTLFGASTAAYPQSWAAHYMYGWALLDAGRNKDASAQLEAALARVPTPDANLRHYLALARMRLGDAKGAETHFQAALAIDPAYLACRHNYGAFLTGQERLDDAAAQYLKVLEQAPDYVDTLNNLGNVLKRQKKLDEAERYLTRAVRLAPGEAEYHNNYASLLAGQRKIEAALAEYREALRLNPAHDVAHDSMGILLLGLGQAREAAAHFEAAIRLRPRASAVYCVHLAAAYEQIGMKTAALGMYREALKLDPNVGRAWERARALESEAKAAGGGGKK